MTTENQPIDRRITVYIPENWIQPTAGSGTGSFINYPTAQTALIYFPGSILCSNFQSFAPTAGMNLFNNSTTGNIQFANANGYTGGIVINADATAPVANTVRIGDSARPVIMPKVKLTDVEGINAAGVFVNADMTIANGFELFANEIKPNTLTTVSLPNGATTTAPANGDTSTRVVTSNWVFSQGFLSSAILSGYAQYAATTPFTAQQTFNAGISTNSIVTIAGNLNLPTSTTNTPPVPDNTALVPTCNWVNTTITNALNATTLFAKYAATTAFTALQTFNLGIATNSIALVSGSTLSLPNILTNSIGLVSGTSLSLPASTTTAPAIGDPGSSRVVTSQWVRDQNYTTTAGFVTYNGTSPFTTQQTFNAGIATDSIVLNAGSFLSLPVSTVPTISIGDSSSKVAYTSWVNTTITNAINAITGFATYAGTTAFTAIQTFNLGIVTNSISLISGTSLSLPPATTATPTVPDNTTLIPTTAWVNTTITNALATISGFATYNGTSPFTTIQTFNAGIKTNLINALGSTDTLTLDVYRMVQTVACFGSAQSIVKNIIGSNAGDSALIRCVCRIATGATGAQNIFNIDTTVVSGNNIIISQYFELIISGRNTGNNNVYTQKTSFIVTNSPGAVSANSFTTDKNYTTGASSVSVGFNQPSATRLVVSASTPSAGSSGQYYYATLVSYPAMNSDGNYQFTVATA
jgi:hypothetical protein